MSSSNPINNSPRRTHRKRISALRLSSDTTSTLPEYIPAASWQHYRQQSVAERAENAEEDKPPDYPDSAEEADEDTDTDTNVFYAPHLPPSASPILRAQTASPRRSKRFVPTHRRRQTLTQAPSDPYLDALLERSVHALEMSNTLLQSSMSTQSSLSTVLASDSPGDSTLEARALGLSSRIKNTWDARAAWADDLEEITRDVEGLFGEGSSSRSRRNSKASPQTSVSASLPSSSSFPARRRSPSLDLHQASNPRLHYSPQNRSNLISPPPRALTQYVASTQDAESIVLPSTLGLRSPPSVHHTADWKPFTTFASSSTTSLLNPTSASLSTPTLPPQLTDKPHEPSTPAYNMLSSFVYRAPSSGSSTPSTSFTSSFMRRRDSSVTSSGTERGGLVRRRSSPSPASHKSVDRIHRQDRFSGSGSGSTSTTSGSSRIQTRGVSPLAPLRPMTPPVEESSSSSSDSCVAKLTVQSLRKILDEQPAPPPKPLPGHDLKPPAFLPRTPAPVAEAGTSTATASISRLFTKGTHSSSTRAPSPPRQSAMKRSNNNSSTAPSTPVSNTRPPSPNTLSIPDLVGRVLKGSAPSSGQSTPSKRISFAQLPESYASTRPPSARFQGKSARRKQRKGDGKSRDGGSGSPEMSSWWGGWLGGSNSTGNLHSSLARHEERIEDRMTRNWGGRIHSGFSGGLEEWAV